MIVGKVETEEERKAREEQYRRNKELSKQHTKEENRRGIKELIISLAVIAFICFIISFETGRTIVTWAYTILFIVGAGLWILLYIVMFLNALIGKSSGSSKGGTTIGWPDRSDM